MKTEDAIVQIYKACKEVTPDLSAKEHVTDLIFNILADLEQAEKKITAKQLEQRLHEHALFAQRCVRKKRRAA